MMSTPSTVVFDIKVDAYSEASLCSLMSSTDFEPRVSTCDVKDLVEPSVVTDVVEVVKSVVDDEKVVVVVECDVVGHDTAVTMVRFMGTVYIHTVVEGSETKVKETGACTKAEI